MKEVVSRKENTSRRAASNTESAAPGRLKAAPPFQLFAGSEKPAQLVSHEEDERNDAPATSDTASEEKKDEGDTKSVLTEEDNERDDNNS